MLAEEPGLLFSLHNNVVHDRCRVSGWLSTDDLSRQAQEVLHRQSNALAILATVRVLRGVSKATRAKLDASVSLELSLCRTNFHQDDALASHILLEVAL